MAEYHYCWKCKTNKPFLNEEEWAIIYPLYVSGIKAIKDYRGRTNTSIAQAKQHNQALPVLVKYRELTGYPEDDINAIWHHRRSDYGPECPRCQHLLRTARAKLCAACGFQIAKDT